MGAESEDLERDVEISRLSNEMEYLVKEINSARIGELVGDVSKESFTQVAQAVAHIRARYLKQVMKLQNQAGHGKVDAEVFARLRSHRLAYEEALEGFNALYHALQKGYFSLAG